MSQNLRDDFSAATKRTVGERAAYICSNPTCREISIGPHASPDKSLKTGEACHINAASVGGPRFDINQSQEERSGISNAIWLCNTCSTKIDYDYKNYSSEKLKEWKQTHEQWLRDGGIIPALPKIQLVTMSGLSIPEYPTTISSDIINEFREHTLTITNTSTCRVEMIDAYIQFPEPVINAVHVQPAGVNVSFEAARPSMTAIATGGGTVTRNRPPLPIRTYSLQIDKLLTSQFVEINFLTSLRIDKEHGLNDRLSNRLNEGYIQNYIIGTFQYEYRGAMHIRKFVATFGYEKNNRTFSVSEVQTDSSDLNLIKEMIFT